MVRPDMGFRRQIRTPEMWISSHLYDFNNNGVQFMRKIGDLVITLEHEKGEDNKIRTKKIDEARKNLGYQKEPAEINEPK